jgi:cell division protein FtsB
MRRSRLGIVATTLVLVVLGFAFVSAIVPFQQILAQRQEVADAAARLAAVEDENRVLQSEITALNTPVEIERLAREKLGYVFPGETAFVVVSPPGAEPQPPAQKEAEPDLPWYTELWSFLTGSDAGR